MYNTYVQSGLLPSLATFYLSQDLLESFFSRLRCLNGSNDNPTIQQVKPSIRKLLFYTEVTSSEFANCEDNLNILTVTSDTASQQNPTDIEQEMNLMGFENSSYGDTNEDEDFANEAIREEERLQNLSSFDSEITSNEDATVAFFAGSLEIRLQAKRFECTECESVFAVNDKIEGTFFENNKTRRPCKSTYLICKYAHIYVDEQIGHPNFDYKGIVQSTLNAVNGIRLFGKSNFNHEDGQYHKLYFIKDIIDEYIRMYCTYQARCITLELHQEMMRHKKRRAYIFSGQ